MDLAGCFIKIGQSEHMIELIQKGLIFCNTLKYFAEIEDEKIRGDDLETVVEMRYMESGEVTFCKPEELLEKDGIKMPFKDFLLKGIMEEPLGNLFCLYKINLLDKPLGEIFTVDAKVKGFGDCFVLIHEPHEFLRRVSSALEKMNIDYSADFVTYLDLSKYTGKKSIFQKDLRYEFQQEYRILIKNKKPDPLSIEIGSIEDIAIICEAADIDKLLIKGQKKDENTYTILANIISKAQ